MWIPVQVSERSVSGVDVPGKRQRLGVVNAEVIGGTICVVGEVGDRAPEALNSGRQIAVS
jgi:hypothetical protein